MRGGISLSGAGEFQNSKSHSSGAGEFEFQNPLNSGVEIQNSKFKILSAPELKFKNSKFKIQKFKNSKFKFQNSKSHSPEWWNFQNSKSHSPEISKFKISLSGNFKIQNLKISASAQELKLQLFKIQNPLSSGAEFQNSNSKSHSSGVEIQNSKSHSPELENLSKFKKLRENFEIQKAAGEFSREFQLRAQLSKTSRLNSQKLQDSTLKNSGKEPKNHEIMKFVFCPKQQKNSF